MIKKIKECHRQTTYFKEGCLRFKK